MRNTAFNTCTTNSRGVKSSLSRMTFHSGGRCVSGLVLLRGLTKVGLIMAVVAPGGLRRAGSFDVEQWKSRLLADPARGIAKAARPTHHKSMTMADFNAPQPCAIGVNTALPHCGVRLREPAPQL